MTCFLDTFAFREHVGASGSSQCLGSSIHQIEDSQLKYDWSAIGCHKGNEADAFLQLYGSAIGRKKNS